MDKIPAQATHYDQEGNFWWISSPEEADGTGEIWTADGWRTSEISTAFIGTLTAVPTDYYGDGPTEQVFGLTYELRDDPGYEHEVLVASLKEARAHLRDKSDMVVWASLVDNTGFEVEGDLL